MLYFESLVERDVQERLTMGRIPDAAFVIDPNALNPGESPFTRLMLAWETYRNHGDTFANWMLDQPVMYVPRIVDRLTTSRLRFSSNGIVKLVGMLYIEPTTGKVKPRSGGDKTTGGIRRLNDVLDQIYMTYDVYGMSAEQLLVMLPDEFKRFNPTAGSARN